ncbi:MAG: hypothetical protein GX299_07635 [Epulopiscium sp.]|jgi:acyl-CoA thioesterase-1|nr:hypothetical protein [Candidatus Epulonipiscium sp.]
MKEITILGFGDSLTFGYGVEESVTFLSRLKHTLPAHYKDFRWNVINSGINGDTTRDAKRRLMGDVLCFLPHIVLILFGSNDSSLCEEQYLTPYEFENNLLHIIETLNAVQLPHSPLESSPIPILITPPPVIDTDFFPFNTTDRVEKYSNIVKKIADEKNIICIDFFSVLNSMGQKNMVPYFQSDGVHLSPKGYELLYHSIYSTLQDLFQKKNLL